DDAAWDAWFERAAELICEIEIQENARRMLERTRFDGVSIVFRDLDVEWSGVHALAEVLDDSITEILLPVRAKLTGVLRTWNPTPRLQDDAHDRAEWLLADARIAAFDY